MKLPSPCAAAVTAALLAASFPAAAYTSEDAGNADGAEDARPAPCHEDATLAFWVPEGWSAAADAGEDGIPDGWNIYPPKDDDGGEDEKVENDWGPEFMAWIHLVPGAEVPLEEHIEQLRENVVWREGRSLTEPAHVKVKHGECYMWTDEFLAEGCRGKPEELRAKSLCYYAFHFAECLSDKGVMIGVHSPLGSYRVSGALGRRSFEMRGYAVRRIKSLEFRGAVPAGMGLDRAD